MVFDPNDGALRFNSVFAVPNPNPVAISFDAAGSMVAVEVRVYTTGMQLVGTLFDNSNFPRGWNQVVLEADFMAGLANGMYFVVLEGSREGNEALSKPAYMVILR